MGGSWGEWETGECPPARGGRSGSERAGSGRDARPWAEPPHRKVGIHIHILLAADLRPRGGGFFDTDFPPHTRSKVVQVRGRWSVCALTPSPAHLPGHGPPVPRRMVHPTSDHPIVFFTDEWAAPPPATTPCTVAAGSVRGRGRGAGVARELGRVWRRGAGERGVAAAGGG